jgi:hypothetical protein
MTVSVSAGHGGARAAEFVKQNLFSNLIKHPKFFTDTKSAIGNYTSPLISHKIELITYLHCRT